MEIELPVGWEEVGMLELCEKIRGVSYDKSAVTKMNAKGLVPVLRANGIQDGKITLEDLIYVPRQIVKDNQILQEGDVVIAMSSGSKDVVGKAAQYRGGIEITFGAFCGVLRPRKEIDGRYIGHFFQSKEYRGKISELASGTNINNLKNSHFASIRVPLPPLSEQQRIVAKLDQLMEKIERSRARLEKIPRILKRFRQSILSAAVTGKLTEEWRESDLYESVRLSEISVDKPELWEVVNFDKIITELRNGLSKRPSNSPPGVPILRISSVRSGSIDLSEFKYYPESKSQVSNYFLKKNDLLFTRYNGTIDLLGVCGRVKENTEFVYPDKLMRVRLKDEAVPEYVEIYFQSDIGRKQALRNAKSSAGQNGISGSDLKTSKLLFPSVEEQNEIVRKVDELFSLADRIEVRYLKAKAEFDKLPQSLLAKAFRGELVGRNSSTDASDELINRYEIRTEINIAAEQ